MKKPATVFLDPKVRQVIAGSDALSTALTVFRNGGKVNGQDAIPFVELTPELVELLRSQKWDS